MNPAAVLLASLIDFMGNEKGVKTETLSNEWDKCLRLMEIETFNGKKQKDKTLMLRNKR